MAKRLNSHCLCIQMRRAAKQISALYDNALSPAHITIAQYFLLRVLTTMEGCGTGELATAVGLEKSTLVRNLKILQANGLIEDRSLPGSRARQLYITDRGQKALDIALPLWLSAQEQVKAVLGDERKSFINLLNVLENIE